MQHQLFSSWRAPKVHSDVCESRAGHCLLNTRRRRRVLSIAAAANETGSVPRPASPGPNVERVTWGAQAFPAYLQNTQARLFPCEEASVPGASNSTWKREDEIWQQIRSEAQRDASSEPLLSSFMYASILAHASFDKALAFVLANRLASPIMLPTQLFEIFVQVLSSDTEVRCGALADVEAIRDRDPACISLVHALLYYKGYHAIQTHRIAHCLWGSGQKVMALALQSRMSEVFAVDIHPAARIGRGILLDHGTGVVIGETAVIGDNCSLMQNITLGGTGKESGDRHPKLGRNVLIGANAAVLGNICIGEGAMIAAGSLVLKAVAPATMVAGSPAREVGKVVGNPALSMRQWSDCQEMAAAMGLAPPPQPAGAGGGSSPAGAPQGVKAGDCGGAKRQGAPLAAAAAAASAPPSPTRQRATEFDVGL